MSFDLNALSIEDTEFSAPEKVNPVVPWLENADRSKTAKQVVVPATEARHIVTLLVKGAEEIKRGVSVRIAVAGTEYASSKEFWTNLKSVTEKYQKEHNGEVPNVTVKFKTKERSYRPRKAAAPEA